MSVEQLYNDIHTAEETGQQTIGWIRGVYPTRATAQAALDAKDLFVLEDAGKFLGAARINKAQVDSYACLLYTSSVCEIVREYTAITTTRTSRTGIIHLDTFSIPFSTPLYLSLIHI